MTSADFLIRLLGIDANDIVRVTPDEIRAALGATLTPEVLEVALHGVGETGFPADFWKIREHFYLDDPTFTDGLINVLDLDYNSEIGLHIREGKSILTPKTLPASAALPASALTPTLHAYEVGELYNPKRTQWTEGRAYNCRKGQHELLLFFRTPGDEEITAVKTGDVEWAVYIASPQLLFLLYKIGDAVPWSDQPFCWWLVPEGERVIPELPATPESRALLHILLIDADTGILKALRALTFPPDVTLALHQAIRAQAKNPRIGEAGQSRLVNEVYRKLPDSAAMLVKAQARGKGGAQRENL